MEKIIVEFPPHSRLNEISKNILRKRYFAEGESKWKQVATRVVEFVAKEWDAETRASLYSLIYNRYFLPNSPTLVNAGKTKHAGLSACFVVPFEDTIDDIYQTKLDFALIARKGGGCGTTLSNLRPEGDMVNGSTHGFAGGPIKFADTVSHDMDAITQSGFRSMAIMFTMSVYHPDILKFVHAKDQEGKIANANISVVVDDKFMKLVEEDGEYWTEFNGKRYQKHKAREVFDQIAEGAWRNGEPGLLFNDRMNNCPYRFAGIEIQATNPCGEQPLPPNGSCNLGSLDISKFYDKKTDHINLQLLEQAVRLGVRFLDSIIDVNTFPTIEIERVTKDSRPIGLGIMGLADYYMLRRLPYGSEQALNDLEFILEFIYTKAKDESERLGKELGVPKWCRKLPEKRRNITTISIAPTGTISLLAGCNSGIEPFFSEITERTDKTGEYIIDAPSQEPYFRCAVSATGEKEVTWEEHIKTQATAQRWSDSGVSKTINFPSHTRKETIAKAFTLAWKLDCKGITVYRNGSRQVEVLSPKNVNKNKCPVCGSDTIKMDGCTKCSSCDWSVCTIG